MARLSWIVRVSYEVTPEAGMGAVDAKGLTGSAGLTPEMAHWHGWDVPPRYFQTGWLCPLEKGIQWPHCSGGTGAPAG